MNISTLRKRLFEGLVIPAHPLALTSERKLDERRQRALTRYYFAAGAGGIAVGVHTTQFAIREPAHGLLRPVLELAAQTARESAEAPLLISGICGLTEQAVKEASLARGLGYDAGLLSLAALRDADDDALIDHCRAVAEVIPLFGFYLQPAVGGRVLSREFWRRFAEIENVVGIKMAPFNRYQTLDVVRAVVESGRANDIALYTGNDDNILFDLVSTYRLPGGGEMVEAKIVGGLLGQWAVGTRAACRLMEDVKQWRKSGSVSTEALTLAGQITDTNVALFDVDHGFAGCIAGIHEVLRRQGLLEGRWCLDPEEELSPGQMEEIARVYAAYSHLHDDAFIREHLDEWMRD
jgi:hypothetical protein